MRIKKLFISQKIPNTISVLIVVFLGLLPFHVNALTVSPIRYEISGNPGETLQEKLNLRNETANTVTYYPNYYNFQAEGETGVPTFVEPKDGLGTWIAAPAGIELAPGDNQTIVFVISIPKDARPGGYFGALLYGTNPPNLKGSSQLAISSQTGPIILLRVNGDIKESASIVEFKTENNKHFYTALPIEMYYRFQNTGADRTKPIGNLIIRNFGIKTKTQSANPVEGNVLPGQIRKIDLVWQKTDKPSIDNTDASRAFFGQVAYEWRNFAIGYFSADLDIFYGADNSQKANSKISFVVFPWQLLIIILIVLSIVIFIFKTLLRRYNKWIIKQAEIAIRRAQENDSRKERESTKRTI